MTIYSTKMEGKQLLCRNRAIETTKSGDLAYSRKEENLLAELEGEMTSAEFNIRLEILPRSKLGKEWKAPEKKLDHFQTSLGKDGSNSRFNQSYLQSLMLNIKEASTDRSSIPRSPSKTQRSSPRMQGKYHSCKPLLNKG